MPPARRSEESRPRCLRTFKNVHSETALAEEGFAAVNFSPTFLVLRVAVVDGEIIRGVGGVLHCLALSPFQANNSCL